MHMKVKDRLDLSKNAIVTRYRAGESTVRISRDYNCNNGSIWLALQRWGEPIRQTKVAAPNRDAILKEHDAGLSAYAIDKKLGLPRTTAERAIKEAGFDISHRQKKRADPLVNHKSTIMARYEQGEGVDSIAADFGTTGSNIVRLLGRVGVKVRTVRDYAHPVDESFFDVVDTEAKAYTLGFWMADGCNVSRAPFVSMSIVDRDILVDMMSAMRYGGPIAEVAPRQAGHLTQWAVKIGSRRLSDALTRLGCVRGKTYLATFPSEDVVPRHLQRHLIRGWMDGDGTITSRVAPSGSRLWHMRIVGTEAVCRGLSACVQSHLGFAGGVCPVHKGPKHTTWGFTVSAQERVHELLGWLYADATIFLARKHEKYREFLAGTAR
jgi:hypothetical protein